MCVQAQVAFDNAGRRSEKAGMKALDADEKTRTEILRKRQMRKRGTRGRTYGEKRAVGMTTAINERHQGIRYVLVYSWREKMNEDKSEMRPSQNKKNEKPKTHGNLD